MRGLPPTLAKNFYTKLLALLRPWWSRESHFTCRPRWPKAQNRVNTLSPDLEEPSRVCRVVLSHWGSDTLETLLKHHDSLSVFPLNIPSRTEEVYALAQDKQGKEFQRRPLHRAHSCIWHLCSREEAFKHPGVPNVLAYLRVQASEKQKQVPVLCKGWLVNPEPGNLEGPEWGSSQLKQNHPPAYPLTDGYSWKLQLTAHATPRSLHTCVSSAARAAQGAHNERVGIQHRLGRTTQGNGSELGFIQNRREKVQAIFFVTFSNRNKRLATWNCRLILTSALRSADR